MFSLKSDNESKQRHTVEVNCQVVVFGPVDVMKNANRITFNIKWAFDGHRLRAWLSFESWKKQKNKSIFSFWVSLVDFQFISNNCNVAAYSGVLNNDDFQESSWFFKWKWLFFLQNHIQFYVCLLWVVFSYSCKISILYSSRLKKH